MKRKHFTQRWAGVTCAEMGAIREVTAMLATFGNRSESERGSLSQRDVSANRAHSAEACTEQARREGFNPVTVIESGHPLVGFASGHDAIVGSTPSGRVQD